MSRWEPPQDTYLRPPRFGVVEEPPLVSPALPTPPCLRFFSPEWLRLRPPLPPVSERDFDCADRVLRELLFALREREACLPL